MPSYADDTDIFVEIEQEGAATYQPNVLFIFDTSGSMGNNVTIREDYDPAVDYGGSDPNKIYVYNSNLSTYITSLTDSQNSCKAMKDQITDRTISGNGDPTWYGKAAYWQERYWDQDRWRTICGSCYGFSQNARIDCQADQGKHGIDDTSTKVYTKNGDTAGPYSSSSSGQFGWGNINTYYYVSANYHDYLQTTTTTTRRKIDIMKDEAKDLVDNFEGLNLGLMRFNSEHGGYAIHHFSDMSDAGEKTIMKNRIDALPASGWTPLTETLWEAGRYYRGDSPDYGNLAAVPSGVISGGKYNSPVVNSCQKNHIVLLTDGQPTRDDGRDSNIRGLTGTNCSHTGGGLATNTCLDELSQYMFTKDQISEFSGDQTFITYTIGFDIDMDLLQQTATKGGGKYYTAGNSTELKAAFTEIIADILDTNTTFTAPAVTVNAYNNLQHKNELYYAIFKPKARTRWPGNIKRYKLDANGDVVDVNDADAVDPTTGFFHNGAKSWWSKSTDGDDVESGGFAEQLETVSKTYVYTGSGAPSNVSLNDSKYLLTKSNTNITNAMMGLPDGTTDAVRNNLIDWANGVDVDGVDPVDNYHNYAADPLHTRPAVVTYGGTATAPDDVVYAMTNFGALHAIDTDNGKEIFRFMPQELLPNINLFYEDEASKDKIYGLDGPLTVWRQESDDSDVTIEASDGDKVYLYLGMRRGGNNYYALDVTDRSNPKLLWKIEGGEGDFTNLGQTWSAPQLTTVNWDCDTSGQNCTRKPVLFFGGGYDTIHDTTITPTTGDLGSTIFMVDAETGELLWSAGKNGDLALTIENSIPSTVKLADINGDGAADVLFALDIMGHFWRVDFNKESRSASDFATGAMIADVSGTSGSELRRFYNSPSVSAISPVGAASFYVVSAGSGYRANPKEEVIADKYFVIFSESVFSAPKNDDGDVEYKTIAYSELHNATSTPAKKADNAPYGFYINLSGKGEKVLSEATVFAGTIFFTTYLTSGTPDQCGVNIGSGKLYGINPLSGVGKFNNSRSINLKHGGIASSPVIIMTGDSGKTTPVLCVGTECFVDGEEGIPLRTTDFLKKTYWREQ